MMLEQYSDDERERLIAEMQVHIAAHGSIKRCQKKMQIKYFSELWDVAKARMKNRKNNYDMLYFNEADLRYATPEIIANYRAERLACNTLVEIGSSVGFQTIAFADTCKKVYAIEIDSRKYAYARKNLDILGIKNVELIRGDALSAKTIAKIKNADIVFCDTERLSEETERRIESIRPNIPSLIKKYSFLTDNICIELPPQMRKEHIVKVCCDAEIEYVSINRKLNRLHAYTGSIAKHKLSVLSLPSGERIIKKDYPKLAAASEWGLYLYVIDTSLERAGLVDAFCKQVKSKGRYLTSNTLIKTNFLTPFKILCKSKKKELNSQLQKYGAGSVVLHGKIVPSDYWSLRKKFEEKLCGSNVLHYFIDENILASPLAR